MNLLHTYWNIYQYQMENTKWKKLYTFCVVNSYSISTHTERYMQIYTVTYAHTMENKPNGIWEQIVVLLHIFNCGMLRHFVWMFNALCMWFSCTFFQSGKIRNHKRESRPKHTNTHTLTRWEGVESERKKTRNAHKTTI